VKALVVRLSAIGDVVHVLPAAAALRAHGWDVGWVVEPAARPLLESDPMLAHLTPVPSARRFRVGSARAAVAALRAHGYDVALDFQGLWKSAAWARLSVARRVIVWSRRWRLEPMSAVLAREQVELPPGITHVIDENLALLRPLGIEAVGRREFALARPGAEANAVAGLLQHAGVAEDELVILNPGGGWPEKLWPAASFGALARLLRDGGLRPVVSWGPGEEPLADRVVAASGGAAVRCFPTTLPGFVELARRADAPSALCRIMVTAGALPASGGPEARVIALLRPVPAPDQRPVVVGVAPFARDAMRPDTSATPNIAAITQRFSHDPFMRMCVFGRTQTSFA